MQDTKAIKDDLRLDKLLHTMEAPHMSGQFAESLAADSPVSKQTLYLAALAIQITAIRLGQQSQPTHPRRVMTPMSQVLPGPLWRSQQLVTSIRQRPIQAVGVKRAIPTMYRLPLASGKHGANERSA